MIQPPNDRTTFDALVQVVHALRNPEGGCPWDLEQTHESLVKYAIEEAHEYAESVDKKEPQAMREELGDMLFQVVLNSRVAEQQKSFTLNDVIEGITEKMIRRHPHVFTSQTVANVSEVFENWEKIKQQEKQSSKKLFNIPPSYPALMTSLKIGEKCAQSGFDWDNTTDVLEKVSEELEEFNEALADEIPQYIEEELGDVLFSLAQLARHLKIDPEACLRKANQKFERRYTKMHELLEANDTQLSNLTADEMHEYWSTVKQFEDSEGENN